MRKHLRQVKQGEPYAVEWPEYHVGCAKRGCNAHALMTNTGEAMSRREAERLVKERGQMEEGGKGWTKKHGLWYCPRHTREGGSGH